MSRNTFEGNDASIFDNLKSHIGSNVVCKVWHWGKLDAHYGVLNEVVDFGYVRIDDYGFPFIGDDTAISEISSESGLLYLNPNVKGYTLKSDEERDEARRLMYGDGVVDDKDKPKKHRKGR